ncbi:fungal protein [Schizosaccharomyces japonicus yFS275]|uniref:Fungal protein n=1 Tax=Schizosaccharomyces japonicus (strain yFS275 / FY16936) TaxID=402676 RepID=B6JZW6_SCHJY|nr:fungal protein [Schizosaccharomyces japonicus yFS275]EEB06116.1 fungal protein [Schizosaccharomyces japonicus yFS275]
MDSSTITATKTTPTLMTIPTATTAPAAPANPTSMWTQAYTTSVPAFGFSTALLASLKRAWRRPQGGPFMTSCLLCGGMNAVGAFAIHDQDLTNGAGIATAWSLAYLLMNGKPALQSLRPYPIALSAFALVNAAGYGVQALKRSKKSN